MYLWCNLDAVKGWDYISPGEKENLAHACVRVCRNYYWGETVVTRERGVSVAKEKEKEG